MINRKLSHQDMPRVEEAPLFEFFDESDGRIDAEQVLEGKILLPAQPYDYDMMSPTPLDPFNLATNGVDYYNAAEMIMDVRLHEMALRHDIPADIQLDVMSETKFEHEHRSHKNADAMGRFRQAVADRGITSFDVQEANEIMRARAGVSRIGRVAILLAKYPEIGGIEVMKITAPFNRDAIALAQAAFIARLRHTERELGTAEFCYEPTPNTTPRPVNTRKQVSPSILPYKATDARLHVLGRTLDVVSRPSYIAIRPDIELPGVEPQIIQAGDMVMNVQQIAVTKYIRIAKQDAIDQAGQ